jgi:hypothetical protein
MNRARFGTTLAFIDFAFNLIIALTALFLLSMLLINPPKQESNTKKEAKYIIVVKWQDGSSHDVDLWVQYDGKNVGFPSRQSEHISLERDDLGPDDTESNTHFIPLNEEVIAIRAFRQGWYTAAVHWYRKRGQQEPPVVRWALISVVDNNKMISNGEVSFTQEGQELTIIRFFMQEDGEIRSIETKTQYPFLSWMPQ